MSIGKSSITKRVAKATEPEKAVEKNIAPELVATIAAAPVAEAKKTPSKATKSAITSKSSKSSTSKPATKKSTSKKVVTEKLTPPDVDPKEKLVDTAVIANISPETVAAVIGHEEKSGYKKVQIGDEMPVYLL